MTEHVQIVSLTYSPGLKKLFESLGNAAEGRIDCDVSYLVSAKYDRIGGVDGRVTTVETSDSVGGIAKDSLNPRLTRQILRSCASTDRVILYNPHPLNVAIAQRLRSGTDVELYLHEPYTPDKASYGPIGAANIKIMELFQKAAVAFSDRVILPSELARERYERYYLSSTPTEQAPFVMDPSTVDDPAASDPEYFTMIGMVNEATGHNHFRQLLEREHTHEYFLITPDEVDFLSEAALRNVETVNDVRRCFDEQVVDDVLARSYAVFKLNRELTQSSVVPDAFKNGTPVIGRDIRALTDQIDHRETGYIVPYDFDTDDLVEAMEYVRENYDRLSTNALRAYDETYSPDQFVTYYPWIGGE